MNKLAKATAILTLSIVTVFFSRFANGELKVKPTQKAIPHVTKAKASRTSPRKRPIISEMLIKPIIA
jgi:hypothetical protein